MFGRPLLSCPPRHFHLLLLREPSAPPIRRRPASTAAVLTSPLLGKSSNPSSLPFHDWKPHSEPRPAPIFFFLFPVASSIVVRHGSSGHSGWFPLVLVILQRVSPSVLGLDSSPSSRQSSRPTQPLSSLAESHSNHRCLLRLPSSFRPTLGKQIH